MLVLSRKSNETILIGEDIVLKVLSVKGKTVRIGIEAPDSVVIRRGELEFEAVQEIRDRTRRNQLKAGPLSLVLAEEDSTAKPELTVVRI